MATVTHYTNLSKYIDQAQELIDQNPMLYHFLAATLQRVINGEEKIHKLFRITSDQNQIIVLLTTEVCLIYDNNFDKDLTSILSHELEFEKFNRYQFAGTKLTIEALFNLNNAAYEIQKHRIIYKCSKVVNNFIPAPGQMQMASVNKIQELTKLSEGFANEYYGPDHGLGDTITRVMLALQSDNFYQWVDHGKVCSIAQSLHDEHDFPVIGHFYTAPQKRGKGYGTSIVHALTKGLLGAGHEFVMLSTNALTPESNRVFEKVGYVQTGEYLLAYKTVI